jgi:excisionase family DNA binding protein
VATVMNRSRLLDIMARRGWSQSDLARAASLPQSTVSRLLSGAMEPSGIAIGKLLSATGLRYDELFTCDVVAAEKYLTTSEVAARLGCNPRYVQRLALRGELRGIRLGSSSRAPFRFTETELARFVSEQRQTAS